MFGRRDTRVIIDAPTQYVTKKVEVRAPTDESVRLLAEFEAKAREKIDQSIRLEGNGFECVVEISLDTLQDAYIATAIFKLNGVRMRAEAVEPARKATPQSLVDKLRDAMATKIAAEILAPALRGVLDKVRWRSS